MTTIKETLENAAVKGWTSELMTYLGSGKRTPIVTVKESREELQKELDKIQAEIQEKIDGLNKACVKYDKLAKDIAQEAINKTLNPNIPYRKLEFEDE